MPRQTLYLAVDAVCYDERGVNRISTVVFGPWELRVHVEQTRACYQQTDEVSAEGCGCDACRNFALTRQLAYPPEVIAFFEELGIDRWKPFEPLPLQQNAIGTPSLRGLALLLRVRRKWTPREGNVHRITPSRSNSALSNTPDSPFQIPPRSSSISTRSFRGFSMLPNRLQSIILTQSSGSRLGCLGQFWKAPASKFSQAPAVDDLIKQVSRFIVEG